MKKIAKFAFIGIVAVLAVNCQNKKMSSSPSSSSGLRSVYYDFDNSFIRNDQVSTLQGNAAYLKSSSGSVTIEGHCDERGTNEYNLALGQRRSDSARDYLMNLGVSSGMMRTVSYGEEKSVCYDHDESCWWKNRRADFRR
jgi:peptidoglycan-associated lipoprotein